MTWILNGLRLDDQPLAFRLLWGALSLVAIAAFLAVPSVFSFAGTLVFVLRPFERLTHLRRAASGRRRATPPT